MHHPAPNRRCDTPKLATKSKVERAANVRENNPAHDTLHVRDNSSSTPISMNDRSRTTHPSQPIRREQVTDVQAAMRHADHIGLMPNRMMTINLEAAGVEDSVATIGRFMKLMGDAMRQQGGELAYIWVRERGKVIGDHVHILFHLPRGSGNWLSRRKPGWLRRCGIARGKGVSHTAVIRGSHMRHDVDLMCSSLYSHNICRVVAYFLKHTSLDVQRDIGIIGKGTCHVLGKRVGISQNLHRAARSKCDRCASFV